MLLLCFVSLLFKGLFFKETDSFRVRFLLNDLNIGLIKYEHSIPNNLRSFDTEKMGHYLLEGHVPIELIKKLNLNSLTITGIAVLGMPHGSPRMEVNNHRLHSHDYY